VCLLISLVAHITQKNVNVSQSVRMLVIDEADLILTYGYRSDLEAIKRHLPKIVQGFMMSATLSSEGLFPLFTFFLMW
jgi:ATP-dependent RNA helicase DDX56/DBP9